MSWYQWLCVLAVPSIFGVIWTTVFNRILKKRDEKEERQRAALKQEQEKLTEQNKATMLGIQALLRDRLLQGFRHYIQQGYAGYDDRKNLENMYTQYEKLGPNSVMDDLYHKFTDLPETLPN